MNAPMWRTSTRREFVGVVGAAGTSLGNMADVSLSRLFSPEAEILWSRNVGSKATLTVSPDSETLLVETPNGIQGLSLDGTERWRTAIEPTSQGHTVEASLGDEVVYVAGKKGLYALDIASGNELWRYDLDDYGAVSLTTSDTVFLNENGITALSTADGSDRWQFDPNDPLWIQQHFDKNTLYVGTIRGHLYALDQTTGSVEWHIDHSEKVAPPRFWVAGSDDNSVFAWDSDGGALYAFDLTDGSLRWQFSLNTNPTGFPGVVRNKTVYLSDGSVFRAISTDDGRERWQYRVGSPITRWSAFGGDTVYVGAKGGVHALSTADGSHRWNFTTGSGSLVYVVGTNEETVFADSHDDTFYALESAGGHVRWKFDYPSQLTWLPQVDDTTYISTESGMVYALTSPDSTLHYDANRLAYSPAGLVLGGFLTTALCAAAYRRWTRPEADTGFDNTTTDVTSFSEFDLGDRIAKFDTKEIFEARLPSGEQVSVTRFDPDVLSVDVFNIAVEMWADLDLPGVLGVREWGTDPVPWVVTDPVDAALADCTGDLPVADLVHALADTAEVVHRAHHASTMHDALGLKNIWLVDGKVRVDGWGIARARRGESPDSDIHRLAVSIRDLLGDQQMDPEQRDELDAVLSRALVDDPDERYESLLRFADALRWAVRE